MTAGERCRCHEHADWEARLAAGAINGEASAHLAALDEPIDRIPVMRPGDTYEISYVYVYNRAPVAHYTREQGIK